MGNAHIIPTCTGCGSHWKSLDDLRRIYPKALSCCPEREMVDGIRVGLLERIVVENKSALIFDNRDNVVVSPGEYYTVAFGVAVDLKSWTCLASPSAKWKIDGTPRWPPR